MTQRRADLFLLICTCIWATTYVVVKDAVEKDLSPLLYIALRMLVAAILLAALRPSFVREAVSRSAIVYGFWLGAFLFCGFALSTIGIIATTPARSAFISSLAVVLVPLIDTALTRKPPPRATLAALVLAVPGLALLTDPWAENRYPAVLLGLNAGDLWTLASVSFFAVQLCVAERVAPRAPAGALALAQVVACGVLAGLASLLLEATGLLRPILLNLTPRSFLALTLTSLFATCLGFVLWLSAQKSTTATRAALIFTLEPVLAAGLSWALGREGLSPAQLGGGALIVSGLVVATRGTRVRDPVPDVRETLDRVA